MVKFINRVQEMISNATLTDHFIAFTQRMINSLTNTEAKHVL